MARNSKKLEKIINILEEETYIEEIETMEISAEFIMNIKENIVYITGEREIGKVLHNIEQILLSVIFAVLAKCNTFVEIHLFMCLHYQWLDKYIQYENGLPSLSTIKRVVGFINPNQLEEVCVNTFRSYLRKTEPLFRDNFFVIEDIKTMDGKTANSSDRKKSKNGKIAKMNAMSIQSIKNEYTEATEFIEEKTNEIPTGITLLNRINIKDSIVVFDAMSTQLETIKYIVKKEGYYVAPVKSNQKSLEECIREYFADKRLYKKAKEESYYKISQKAHGGYEKREYIFTNDIDWIYKRKEWKDLKSIGIVKRTYEDSNGKQTMDIRYYISNLSSKRIELIAKAIREEWHIENKLHWYLDMVFMEDNNRCFLDNSQKNLNIIRKFCLGLLKRYKEEKQLSLNSIRHILSMDFERVIEDILSTLYK